MAGAIAVYNLPQLLFGTVQFDGVDVHYSAQRYLSDELHAGRLPVWTPYIFSGFPFLADLQVGAWYPLNWPFLLVGIVPRSIGAELALHALIAGVGTYLLAARAAALGPGAPAFAAAVLYAMAGWFATHSQHVGMFDTAAWLPWLLLLLEHLAERVTLRRLALAGVLGAAIALPGTFQLALYTFSFVALWAVCESAARRSWLTARRWAIGLGAAAVWGGCLAAVMVLPALELVSQSVRVQLNALALRDIGYFHPSALLTLVYPDYYGLLSGHYIGPGDSTQHYFYAGILLVPLAVLGVRNVRLARTAAFLGVPFLAYALGPSGGVFRVVARVPGFSSVELPMHGWFLPALGLALLGGAGLAAVERRVGPRWTSGLLAFAVLDVLVINQLMNPLAYARASFDSRYGSPLRAFANEIAQANPPVERVYGPELAAVGYRNHGLQSRVETTYGYNPLELATYAAFVAQPGTRAGQLSANYQLIDGGRLQSVADGRLLVSSPARLVRREATRVVFHYATPRPAAVEVAIPWYPGWRATLNGTELPLARADGAFMHVQVPPGDGDVQLSYWPRYLVPGALVSGLALVALLVTCVATPRRAATGPPLPCSRE